MKRTSAAVIALATVLVATTASAASSQFELQAPRNQDIQAPRDRQDDLQAPRSPEQDIQAPRTSQEDIQAPRGQEIQAPRG